ncbi:hypothetical protein PHJA_002007100 [Phtheirospermum japonicum]|uniref:Uncharacterized protein n=1 Tax=Phtheirospermum japonicum TaxID=374723 RepID=A0A830CK67_9LAMI|nr:hypothetical protein PHJA_002007100 [Phtheirospermum japonicum]
MCVLLTCADGRNAGPLLGEETLLCIGLFAGFLNMLLDSIAWAPWIRCIMSKQVGPYEQGTAQGCLMAIASFANVISPVVYSPLSGRLHFCGDAKLLPQRQRRRFSKVEKFFRENTFLLNCLNHRMEKIWPYVDEGTFRCFCVRMCAF